MAAVTLNTSMAQTGSPSDLLRTSCQELVGMTLFGPMLKQARESSLNSGLLDSSAQRMFRSELDDVFAQQASHQLSGGLVDAMVKQFSRPGAAVDIEA